MKLEGDENNNIKNRAKHGIDFNDAITIFDDERLEAVDTVLKKLSLYSGMVIPIWLFVGVAIAGAMNPGYSYVNQAMRELGAKGSMTHVISPIINNFPLGILFIATASLAIVGNPYCASIS